MQPLADKCTFSTFADVEDAGSDPLVSATPCRLYAIEAYNQEEVPAWLLMLDNGLIILSLRVPPGAKAATDFSQIGGRLFNTNLKLASSWEPDSIDHGEGGPAFDITVAFIPQNGKWPSALR